MLLNLLDLRTPWAQTVHCSTLPDDVIANLAPLIRKGNGVIAEQWSFDIRAFLPRHGIPGTAFGSGHQMPPAVVGGIRFEVRRDTVGVVLIGWLAWQRGSVVEQISNEIVDTIARYREPLGSLCPINPPGMPTDLPWMAVLRMPAWRQLTNDQQHDLGKLSGCIGCAAIGINLCKQSRFFH